MLFRCRRCLYSNQKPDIHFNAGGICSACQAFDRRQSVDWAQREREFLQLVRANPGKSHDVIVACSGGKDSTWQVVKCLELGLNPLAVTATTDHLTAFGRRNLDNISRLCDHIEITPHKEVRRHISKFALTEVGDISWCEHHLIWSIPARESVARNIPIVLYGENPQNEMGAGPAGTETREFLTKDWVDEFGGLLGLRVSDLTEILDIHPKHLELYRYPYNADRVRAVFMGAFFPWDGRENARVAEERGFRCAPFEVEGSYGSFENLDNAQTGIHDWMRWLKFGYSRATDILSFAIRRGRMTREEAAEIALSRDGKYPETYMGIPLDDILGHIGMKRKEFDAVCERFIKREVVDWALRPESYQSFFGQNTDASRDDSLARTAA